MIFAYIGLGSNLGGRENSIQRALDLLSQTPALDVLKSSSLYETQPVDCVGGGWFLNSAVKVKTNLEPHELLTHLKSIEEKLGRDREHRNGPRTIDLDILLYGDHVVRESQLTIPHPKLAERSFALIPLLEIDSSLQHPVQKRSLHQLLCDIKNPSTVRFFKKMTFTKACSVGHCT